MLLTKENINKSIENNNVENLKKILKETKDFSIFKNDYILKSVEYNYPEIINVFLLDLRFNPNLFENYCIRHAALNKNYKVVHALLKDKRVDPSANNNFSAHRAFENNDIKTLALLIADKRVKNKLKIEEPDFFVKVSTFLLNKKITFF